MRKEPKRVYGRTTGETPESWMQKVIRRKRDEKNACPK